MTKLSRKALSEFKKNELKNQLWKAITLLESKDEVFKLLSDLLSRTEIQMLSKRLAVARMLIGGAAYKDIREELKVTDVTISKINNSLDVFGEGYRLIINRLNFNDRNSTRTERRPFVRGQIKAAQDVWKGLAIESIKAHNRYKKRNSAKT